MKPHWRKGRADRGPPAERGKPRAEPRSGGASLEQPAGSVRIFGFHAVEAVLQNQRRAIKRVLATDNAERRLAPSLAARQHVAQKIEPRDLDRLLGDDTVHQGVLVETEPLAEPTLTELCVAAEQGGPLVVLDQVTDPHNVGAILRSAAVFGAAGLVMTRRHSPPLSGALAKTASGALEHVPVALVGNLAQAMAQMADAGLRRIGLDGEAADLIQATALDGPIALVLGSEGVGLRRLTRDLCDTLCRIGSPGAMASLNVSNAAAVALYAVSARGRPTGSA